MKEKDAAINLGISPLEDLQFGYKRRWPAMIVLLSANFVSVLDVGVVNVALPTIQSHLGADNQELEWVVTAYILTYALALLPSGKGSDWIGRRKAFLFGLAAFILTSFLCALSVNIESLIISRALQGIAAAIMAPQLVAIAQTMFAPKERAGVFSLFGFVASLASIAGPFCSGVLINIKLFSLSWQPIFLVNVPVGVAILIGAIIYLPKIPTNASLRMDFIGLSLFSLIVLGLIFPLIESGGQGWLPLPWCRIVMISVVPLCWALIAWERWRMRESKALLLPLYILKNRDYALGTILISFIFSAMQGFFLVFSIYLQRGLGRSALATALIAAPFPIGALIASFLAPKINNLRAKILMGIFMQGANIFAIWLIVKNGHVEDGVFYFVIPLLIGGIGSGFAISSLFQTVLRSVAPRDIGVGAAFMQVIQQIGGAVGIALVSGIFFSQIELFHKHVSTALTFNVSFLATFIYYVIAYGAVFLLAPLLHFKIPNHNSHGEKGGV